MRTTLTRAAVIALTVGSAATLAACGSNGGGGAGGGDGGTPLTQAQTDKALLTDSEFPLDGWTRGDVQSGVEKVDDAAIDDLSKDLPTDQVSKECIDALGSLAETGTDSIKAQTQADFSPQQTEDTSLVPTTVNVVVATVDGDSPYAKLGEINDACDDVTIEQDGMEMKLSFDELSDGDAQGTKMSVSVMGISIDAVMASKQSGDNVAAVMGTGVSEADVIKILDAQMTKVDAAS